MKFDTNTIISALALLVSVITLIIYIKDKRTSTRTYLISRNSHSRNDFDVVYIKSQQVDNKHLIMLAVYNPSSVKLLLKCVKVYRSVAINKPLYNFFRFYFKWEQVEAVWWPSEKAEFTIEKYLDQEYENLMVTDKKNLFINVPSASSSTSYRDLYKFEIMSTFGNMTYISTIGGSNINFCTDFKLYHKDE